MKKTVFAIVLLMVFATGFCAWADNNDDVVRQKMNDAVLKVYTEHLEKNPGDVNTRFARANQYYYNGNPQAALDDVSNVLQVATAKDKDLRFDALLLRAQIYDYFGKLDDELTDLKEALDMNPGSLPVVYMLANLSIKMNDLDAAERNYKVVLAGDPRNYEAMYGLANVELKRNNYGEAAKYVDKAVELYPTVGKVYVNRADVLKRMGEYEAATNNYLYALTCNDMGTALDDLFALSNEHYDDVMKALENAINKAPDAAAFYRIRSTIAISHLHYGQALRDLKTATNHGIIDSDAAFYDRALCEFHLTQYPEALQSVNAAIAKNAADPAYHVLKARILNAKDASGKDAARQALAQAIAVDATNTQARLEEARLLIEERKNEQAVKLLTQALESNPNDAETLLLRAWVNKYRLNKADEAKADFEKIVANPAKGINSLRGFALHELGRADEARAWAADIINDNPLPGGNAYYYAAALLSDMDDNEQAYKYFESCLANGFGSLYLTNIDEAPYVNLKLLRRADNFKSLVNNNQVNFTER